MNPLGVCAPVTQSKAAKAAGFDYLEPPLTSLKGDEGEAAFAPVMAAYQASALPVRAFNQFLPGDLKVTGPDIDEARLEGYLERALTRAARLGASRVVFGSGGARRVPEGFPFDEAQEQLVRFLKQAAGVAAESDLVVVVEPLRQAETNIVHTVAEGTELAARVDHPNVRVLADFYHMDEEGEPLEHLVTYKDWLEHVHVADTSRLAPGTGAYPYEKFVTLLRDAGYQGGVSVECSWRDFETEAAGAVQFLRRVFSRG